jgi:hypothetical protein
MATIRAHQLRLRAGFRHAVLMLLAAPAAIPGCTGDDILGVAPDASVDATTGSDVQVFDAPLTAQEASVEGSAALDATAPVDATVAEASTDARLTDVVVDATPGDAGDEAGDDAEGAEGAAPSTLPTCSDASVGAPYYLTDSGMYCYYLVDMSCPLYPTMAGSCDLQACDVCSLDGAPNYGCHYVDCPDEGDSGIVTVMCDTCIGFGRRPAGLARPAHRRSKGALGEYFARASHLEAASVRAFERLRSELAAHGAPRELQRGAERSARDEQRHARVTGRLARRFGGEPPPVRGARKGVRSLERIALENAVEGCVRETAGALVATWQASCAEDAGVRRSMARIAVDETLHAALAWAVADWIEPQLSPGARERVRRARRDALGRLEREMASVPPLELVRVAGVPSARQARALVDSLRLQLAV